VPMPPFWAKGMSLATVSWYISSVDTSGVNSLSTAYLNDFSPVLAEI